MIVNIIRSSTLKVFVFAGNTPVDILSSQGSQGRKPCNKMQKKESKYPIETTLNQVYINYTDQSVSNSYFLEVNIQ
jgi:hypothetical protein